MSVLSVSHLFIRDILDDLGIMPYWEQVRRHLLSMCTVAALFILYTSTQIKTPHCLPSGNTTDEIFSNVKAGFVNSYCANKYGIQMSYASAVPILSVLLINICSSSWLYFPKVTSSFCRFMKAVHITNNSHLTLEEMKERIVLPAEDKKENLLLQKACQLIFDHKGEVNLKLYYRVRCTLLIIFTGASFAVSAYYTHYLKQDNQHLDCQIQDEDWELVQDSLDERKFFCSYTLANMLYPFYLFLAITLALQLPFIGVGMCNTRGLEKYLKGTAEKDKTVAKSLFFIRMFWRGSSPEKSEAFEDLLKFLFSNDTNGEIKKNLEKAICAGDIFLLQRYISINDSSNAAKEEILRKVKDIEGQYNDEIKMDEKLKKNLRKTSNCCKALTSDKQENESRTPNDEHSNLFSEDEKSRHTC